jgi:predicted transcriptional regulator
LDNASQNDFIKTSLRYIQKDISLTRNKLSPIFTQVSNNVNNIAMTIADEIREETMEFATFQHIKGLLEEGLNADTIAKAFKMPLKKVREIIQKIKDSSN